MKCFCTRYKSRLLCAGAQLNAPKHPSDSHFATTMRNTTSRSPCRLVGMVFGGSGKMEWPSTCPHRTRVVSEMAADCPPTPAVEGKRPYRNPDFVFTRSQWRLSQGNSPLGPVLEQEIATTANVLRYPPVHAHDSVKGGKKRLTSSQRNRAVMSHICTQFRHAAGP